LGNTVWYTGPTRCQEGRCAPEVKEVEGVEGVEGVTEAEDAEDACARAVP
jgi:hypothetical protein